MLSSKRMRGKNRQILMSLPSKAQALAECGTGLRQVGNGLSEFRMGLCQVRHPPLKLSVCSGLAPCRPVVFSVVFQWFNTVILPWFSGLILMALLAASVFLGQPFWAFFALEIWHPHADRQRHREVEPKGHRHQHIKYIRRKHVVLNISDIHYHKRQLRPS